MTTEQPKTIENPQGLRIAIGESWQPKYLAYFSMSMMALMLITNVLNLKFVNVGGYSIIGSQIIYSLSLIITDIMAEVYGYKRVRRLLYVGLGFLIFYAVCLQVAVILPPALDYKNDAAFRTLFSQTPRIAAASIIAYFFGELTASFSMSRLKVRWRAKHFYGRAIFSVGIAQLIDGIIFFGVAFAGIMSLRTLASSITFGWLTVMICEFFVLPITKKLAWHVMIVRL